MKRGAVARGSERDRRRHEGLLVGISCLLPIMCTCVCVCDASRPSPDRVSAPSGPWAAPVSKWVQMWEELP